MINRINDLLVDLATCLCAQITADGSPPLCFCGVIPGDQAIAAYAGECDDKCGMAWVRLMSAYPSVSVGQPDEANNNCGAMLGMDVEVGIIRCMEWGGIDGEPPTMEQLMADSAQQTLDAMTIWRAVACCPTLSNADYSLRTYVPLGPMGGFGGGSWQVSVIL